MNKKIQILALSVIISISFIMALAAQDGGGDTEQGIWHFKHENYEEALAFLIKAREEDPDSSLAAYYLGVTYKRMQDYKSARPHLEAAVSQKPKVKGALIELIDLLYRLGEIEEAKKWIAVAEEEGIRPAQTAFLKGLALLKEGDDIDGAVASLSNARKLDDSLEQVVKYETGVARLRSKKLKDAKKLFESMSKDDPSSDLALFATEYTRVINNRLEQTKPLKLTFGTFYQYDDNVTLRPGGDSLASSVTDDADNRIVYAGSAEYNLRVNDNLGARFGYAFYYGDQLALSSFDVLSHIYAIQPAFYLDKIAFTFPLSLTHLRVDDRDYLNTINLGTLNNFMINPNQMIQGGFTYKNKDFKWDPFVPQENRDSNEYLWQLAYYHFTTKDKKGFITLRHQMNIDDTVGRNWEYFGNETTLSAVIPLHEKAALTTSGRFFLQDFLKSNSLFGKERLDTVFTLSSMLSIEVFKHAELQIQYTYVNNGSNIDLYEYERNVYSAGMQVSF
ncbi:MAG: tetratricopeptide repeat protein [Candidatus Omnitrophota bacterium]